MQKSLRAGTKRPLTMVLVHAFWSFTSSKWGTLETREWPGSRAPACKRSHQDGWAWALLCTVDPDTSHCGLFPKKWTICSRKALRLPRDILGERPLTYSQRKFCRSRVPEVFCLDFKKQKNDPTNHGETELGEQDFKWHSLYKICT